jgi:hypothetical protein
MSVVRMSIVFDSLQPWEPVLAADTIETGYPAEKSPGFLHTAIHECGRVMIWSSCIRCGAGRVVSVADGSLQKWECGHMCVPKPAIEEQEYSN